MLLSIKDGSELTGCRADGSQPMFRRCLCLVDISCLSLLGTRKALDPVFDRFLSYLAPSQAFLVKGSRYLRNGR